MHGMCCSSLWTRGLTIADFGIEQGSQMPSGVKHVVLVETRASG